MPIDDTDIIGWLATGLCESKSPPWAEHAASDCPALPMASSILATIRSGSREQLVALLGPRVVPEKNDVRWYLITREPTQEGGT